MGDPLAQLAHELKTPLTGVLGAIELILDPAVDLEPEEVQDLLVTARSEGNHLSAILDGIVRRNMLEEGSVVPDRAPVAVVALVDASFDRFPGVSDRTSVIGDLSAKVDTDADLAGQILTNLVQNVRRYAPTGPVTVEVREKSPVVEITVRDSGPGFDPSRGSQGMGIGLQTASQLADLLGGILRADPTPSEGGASFTLALPSTDEAVPAVTLDREVPAPPRARLLSEIAQLVAGSSVDRTLGGIARLSRSVLSTSDTAVVEVRDRRLVVLRADTGESAHPLDGVAEELLAAPAGTVTMVEPGSAHWLDPDAGSIAVTTMDQGVGLLVTTWDRPEHRPPFAVEVLPGFSTIARIGVERRSLDADLDFERRIRSAVMDSLPIAISVFAGDPPRVVDWNRAEAEMLGTDIWDERGGLDESQRRFHVRFEDGTPLDEENAPVVRSIRTGESTGPMRIRVTRSDGSEILVRTYCAPVVDDAGVVIGAVVTSEPVD